MFAARNMLFAKAAAAGGGGITAAAFVQAYMDSSNLTTYTFTACDLGAADANRHIIVVVGNRESTARTISTATINGVSATVDHTAQGSSGFDVIQIMRAAVPTGATGDIVVTLSGASQRMGIGVYRVVKSTAPTIHDTATGIDSIVASMNIDIADGGCVIGGSFYRVGQANVWTGLTRDFASGVSGLPGLDGGAVGMSGASSGIVTPAETARAVTCTNTSFITAAGLVSYV